MSRETLKISLIQDNPTAGDVRGNVELAIEHIRREADAGADLVVFSECFVSGYPIGDLALRPGFIGSVAEGILHLQMEITRISARTDHSVAVLIGAPRSGSALPYNSAFLIEPGGATRIVDKTELPNFDVFDEHRTFARSALTRHEPLRYRGFALGVMICEDMWHGQVPDSLASEGADVLIAINGSPYHGGKQAVRMGIANAIMRRTGLPIAYVNQVGGQDELVFDGGSFIANSDVGHFSGHAFRPDVLRAEIVRDENGKAHIEMRADDGRENEEYPENRIETDYRAAVLGLKDYARKTGTKRVYVGVSGGLDSALVLAIAKDAMGPKNVVGVMMPSAHTGQESLDLAADLMARLQVVSMTIPIGDTYEAINAAVTGGAESLDRISPDDLGFGFDMKIARENFQARARGMILMGLSNAMGGIVLSTGNKSELAVGYSTLYGDMVGGFNPIKSVYKSDAFEMCRWRNAHLDSNVIPEGIINRPPTAELSEGQTDEAALGSYDVLDAVLREMIDNRSTITQTVAVIKNRFGDEKGAKTAGLPVSHYVDKVYRMVRNAQYKRYQAPPGVKLNATDFGLGWRYPIAGRYSL